MKQKLGRPTVAASPLSRIEYLIRRESFIRACFRSILNYVAHAVQLP